MPSPLHSQTTIDNDIKYCQWNSLFTENKPSCIHHCYGGRPVIIGNFAFDCRCHDTGNGVNIYVINGDKSRQIVNTEYWFSSRYTFNESKWESGPWDKALSEAIAVMKKAVEEHKAKGALERAAFEAEKAKEEMAEKDSWSAVFA